MTFCEDQPMRFTLLLFSLAHILRMAARFNTRFKRYIAKARVRIMIKPVDNSRGRLLIFDKGRVSSIAGTGHAFDAALVWQDAATGFSVMTSKKPDASFNAAAEGKLRVEGMSVYAQWLEDGLKLIL
jgi:hypothetical protein